ncbi:MAG: hypothetical protein KDE19_02965 [Caldilineaceae bacterium]|nr:hypothetical protein [Caldilineaceae bacterium]
MRFAKWAFWIAGALGILEIAPLYFMEAQLAVDMPPALTHPEFYYGFAGVTLAWQLAFLVLGSDPQRYRPLMPVAVVEKVTFVVAAYWLWTQGRLPSMFIGGALLDLTYGIGFVVAYFMTGRQQASLHKSM